MKPFSEGEWIHRDVINVIPFEPVYLNLHDLIEGNLHEIYHMFHMT